MLENKATLRVTSNTLSLAEIVSVIGKPTRGFSKGDLYRKGSQTRAHTQWMLKSTFEESICLERHIVELVSLYTTSNIDKIIGEIEVDIVCMLSSENGQGGFELSPKIMNSLGQLNLKVTFDIYSD